LSELKLTVPWGHIAAKAWGSLRGPPVLCLHGWLDNANSFDRLIPLLPQDFYYVAMDFGGHGLSSHYSPGVPYYHQNFVNEVRRVVAALKWSRFSLMGHSFGEYPLFSCTFPEMVDELILLDASPFAMDINEMENLLTYKRRAIEHVLQVEASQKPSRVVSPEEMLQGFLKNNSHVGEECGKLLLQRGTTWGATGKGLPLQALWTPEYSFDFISRELFTYSIQQLQAHVLLGTSSVRITVPGLNGHRWALPLPLATTHDPPFLQRFQFVQIPGNHYVHMNAPHLVASVVSSFLQSKRRIPAQL
uniref:Serine hydrolase like 2 n=1 Tax=Spermophilus dauricus TaxID=99837 RepID=A0A8C9Q2Y3_SPEDA